MKKLLAVLLAMAMVFSLVACTSKTGDNSQAPDNASTAPSEEGNTSEMKVAMVTDYGDITDQSFNQTTYEACKAFCDANNVQFNYYKPTTDSTSDRVLSIVTAITDGYNVIVMPGYAFGGALAEITKDYPNVKFVALDVAEGDILGAAVGDAYYEDPTAYKVTDYYNAENTYSAVFQEELCCYMAGYAAVKLGYRHLGFLGGMAVPAVIRYGYGYLQGADAAAVELGVEQDVKVEFAYGNQFNGDADITAYMDNWYKTLGVEIVFACGGSIYTSAGEAVRNNGGKGKVIGVDVDQKAIIDGDYGDGITVTSAMKGLSNTVDVLLTAIKDGKWDQYVGKIDNLGLVDGEDPTANFVQIPMDSTQWNDDFTQDDYKAMVKDMFDGTIKVSNDTANNPEVSITVNYAGNIK